MAALVRPNPIEKLPGWGAAVSAVAVGLVFVALPSARLDAMIDAGGIAAVLSVAAPPLGAGARAVLALGGGALVAVVVWSVLYTLFGVGGILVSRPSSADGVPVVRRADAHPDAPPRRPLSAAELGGIALPRDLDTPLSALDPGAIPQMPREPVRPVAPLASGERMRIFALAPPAPVKPMEETDAPSIDGLLRRLGDGRAAF